MRSRRAGSSPKRATIAGWTSITSSAARSMLERYRGAFGHAFGVAITDFPTKAAVVVRDDLAVWQRLNVTGFLVSGLVGGAGERIVGEDYVDADGVHYLPMLVQPLLVLEASGARMQTVRRRAADRHVPIAIYTAELFATGADQANRAAVKAVATDDLDLVGIGIRAPHRDADA